MANPAAIVSHSTLVSALQTYLLAEDVTTNDIDLFIALAEDAINDELRLESVLTKVDSTALVTPTVAIPANYIDTKLWRLATVKPVVLTFLDDKTFSALPERLLTGTPKFYTILNGLFEFAPAPDQSFPSEHFYLGQVTSLTSGAPTNELLPGFPLLYLSGALVQAYTFFEDDAALARWQGIYERQRQQIMGRELRRRWKQNAVMQRM